MNRDDVRVREPRRHPRLAEKALLRGRGVREMRRKDLDRDVTIELHVAGEVDDSHAATPQLTLERVLASEGSLQVEKLRGRLCHSLKLIPQSVRRGARAFIAGPPSWGRW